MATTNDLHHRELTEGLYSMYVDNILTDVTLVAGHVTSECHRNVLAAASPYFRAMFTNQVREREEKVITLHNIEPDALKDLIGYIYTGNIEITNENVQDMFVTATMFEIHSLFIRCSDHMIQEICISNCVEVYIFSKHFACLELQEFVRSFLLEHFSDIVHDNDKIYELDFDDIEKIISSDELSVETEDLVYTIIDKWTSQENRLNYFPKLFKHVRLPLISDAFLEENVKPNPLIAKDPYSKGLLLMLNLYKIQANTLLSLSNVGADPDDTSLDDLGLNDKPRHGMFNRAMLVFSSGAYAADERSLTAFDPVTMKNYIGLKPHPTFDFKFKVDYYQLVSTTENKLFIIGGIFYDDHHFEDYGHALKDVYQFNGKEIKWEKRADMNIGRCCFSTAVHDNKIFVIGGKPTFPRGEATDLVEFYNIDDDVWISASPAPIKIYNHASSVSKDAIFVFGGKDDDDDILDTVFRYDISRDSWTLVTTQMATPRAQLSAFSYRARIYLVGGASVNENIMTVAIYDPDRNTWSHGEDFPEERRITATSFHEGTIFVCGGVRCMGVSGRRSRQVESRDLYKFEIEKNSWSKVVKLVQYGNTQASTVNVLNTKYLQESDFVSSM